MPHPHARCRLLLATAVLVVGFSFLFSPSIRAATGAKDAGLLITPLRQYPKIDAGRQQDGSFTVANLTNQSMLVSFSVKQFSVSDYTYDYRFTNPDRAWLHLGVTEATLAPGASRAVPYSIIVPPNMTPGGYYYTLVASARVSGEGLGGTIQAATLLYVTVNGKLIESTRLQASSIQRVSFGSAIAYKLAAADTGNVHYFVYVSGQLHGLFAKNAAAPVTHLLMPQTIRQVSGTIPAPSLPGMYRATYGYTTDAGQHIARSQLVVFIPPWSIAALLGLGLLADAGLRHRRKRRGRPAGMSTGGDHAGGAS